MCGKVPMSLVFPLRACVFYGLVLLLVVRYGRNTKGVFPRSKNASDCHLPLRIQIFIWPSSLIPSILDTILNGLLDTLGERGIFGVYIETMGVLFVFELTVPIAFFKSFYDFLYLFLHHSIIINC